MFPIPNQMAMWPQLPQPAAVGRLRGQHLRHGLAALLVRRPDPRPGDAPRPRQDHGPRRSSTALFALGWRGSNRHWQHYERAYLLLAALATPLVLSVHSVVSFDFAVSQLPGLAHDDLPALLRRRRDLLRLRDGDHADGHLRARCSSSKHIITMRHLENMAKIILAHRHRWSATPTRSSSSSPGTAATPYEQFAFVNRAFGPYAWAYWIMVTCNVLVPQLFWFKKVRTQPRRAVRRLDLRQRRHVVRALRHRRHLAAPRLPAVELGLLHADLRGTSPTFVGSFGLFFTLFLLFVRFLPMVAMAEVKSVLPQADPHHADGVADSDGERAEPMQIAMRCQDSRRSTSACWPSSPTPSTLLHACEQGARRGLHALGRPHARSRSTASTGRWGSGARRLPWLRAGHRAGRRRRRHAPAVVGVDRRPTRW